MYKKLIIIYTYIYIYIYIYILTIISYCLRSLSQGIGLLYSNKKGELKMDDSIQIKREGRRKKKNFDLWIVDVFVSKS